MVDITYKSHQQKNPLRISVSSSGILSGVPPQLIQSYSQNSKCAQCVRCGFDMAESLSVIVIIHPPVVQVKSNTSNSSIGTIEESCCSKCGLPNSFHSNYSSDPSTSDGLEDTWHKDSSCQPTPVSENGSKNESTDFWQEESDCSVDSNEIGDCSNTNESVDEAYDEDCDNNNNVKVNPRDLLLKSGGMFVPPCVDCHIALIQDPENSSNGGVTTLMLQVPYTARSKAASEIHVPESNIPKVATSVRVNAPALYPGQELVAAQEEFPGKKAYDQELPEFDPEAEAAYQCHLRNLVPCEFCGRRFNPDRVMVHENACIERSNQNKRKGNWSQKE